MTYNFDPERWHDAHLAALQARRERGELDEAAFEAERAELARRYEELVERLDGTYQMPPPRQE